MTTENKTSKAKPAKKGERQAKYSKEKVIALFMEQGLRVSDIAKKLAPISQAYVSRILFGSQDENSGGISPEQKKRRAEYAARIREWAKEKVADKKASK